MPGFSTQERHQTAQTIMDLKGHVVSKGELHQVKWAPREGGRIAVLNHVFHAEAFDTRGRYMPLLIPHFTLQFHFSHADRGEISSFIKFTPHDATLESAACEKPVIMNGVAHYPSIYPGDVWDEAMASADELLILHLEHLGRTADNGVAHTG
jgi:hypothetical protein